MKHGSHERDSSKIDEGVIKESHEEDMVTSPRTALYWTLQGKRNVTGKKKCLKVKSRDRNAGLGSYIKFSTDYSHGQRQIEVLYSCLTYFNERRDNPESKTPNPHPKLDLESLRDIL